MVVRALLLLLAATRVVGSAASPEEDAMSSTVYLVPFGKTDLRTVEALRKPLEERFRFQVRVDRAQPIPHDACNAGRKQYLSTAFLRVLLQQYPDNAAKALGVADVDLYVPRLRFVFGEAEKPGNVAVISLTRLRPEYYGEPVDNKVFVARMVKEAVHELGHTFGLSHCISPDCVMFFSNSLRDTDRKSADFCTECAGGSPYTHADSDTAR